MPRSIKINVDACINTAYEILDEAPDRADTRIISTKLAEAQTYALLAIAESLRQMNQRGQVI
jgi:hypothetical protein